MHKHVRAIELRSGDVIFYRDVALKRPVEWEVVQAERRFADGNPYVELQLKRHNNGTGTVELNTHLALNQTVEFLGTTKDENIQFDRDAIAKEIAGANIRRAAARMKAKAECALPRKMFKEIWVE